MSAFPAITELVPHAAPMLAIDELVDWSPGRASVHMVVRADTMFVAGDSADSVACLEWMAQAVAACLGMDAWNNGDSVRVGMVVACRQLELRRSRIAVGTALRIDVRCVHGSPSASHYDAEIADAAGERVAAATLTLVHGERPPG